VNAHSRGGGAKTCVSLVMSNHPRSDGSLLFSPARQRIHLQRCLRQSISGFARACGLKKAMRIIHECPAGQGGTSASPKGCARALAPSQSYRFVSISHGLSCFGRRPQIFPKISLSFLEGRRVPGTHRPTAIGPWALPVRSRRGQNRVTPSSFYSYRRFALAWALRLRAGVSVFFPV